LISQSTPGRPHLRKRNPPRRKERKGKIVAFSVLLYNDAPVMHVIRKFVAATLALALLLISSVPVTSAVACRMDGMQSSEMSMSEPAMQIEPVSPLVDGQDCFIECGCRIDNHLDGMPHQLAPHALSMNTVGRVAVSGHLMSTPAPTLIARPLALSPPPPRTI